MMEILIQNEEFDNIDVISTLMTNKNNNAVFLVKEPNSRDIVVM